MILSGGNVGVDRFLSLLAREAGTMSASLARTLRPFKRYDAVLFDLLTAVIDSWTLWNDVAGDPGTG